MREFNQILFLGNGETSLANCYRLHKKLNHAISILGGLQQPAHPNSKQAYLKDKQKRRSSQKELDDIIDDLLTALGRK